VKDDSSYRQLTEKNQLQIQANRNRLLRRALYKVIAEKAIKDAERRR